MYCLDTTTRTLEIYNNTLNSQHYYEVSYVDITTTTATPGVSVGLTAVTATNYNTICSAPAASTQRIIKSIKISPGNSTTVDTLWNLYLNDNGTRYSLFAGTAAGISSWGTLGASHTYTDQTGWTTQGGGIGSGNLIANPCGRYCQPLRPACRIANITATIALTLTDARAVYLGPVNFAAQGVVVQWRLTAAPSGTLTYCEVAVCQGTSSPASNITLKKLGSISWGQNTAVGVKTYYIPFTWAPDPAAGNDLYFVIGTQTATNKGTLRGGVADDLQSGITYTASVRPSAITPPSGAGTSFTISGSTIVVPLIQAMYI